MRPGRRQERGKPWSVAPLTGASDRRGFTLLEMLIALVVLSIGVLGYTAVQYQSIGGRAFSKLMNKALTSGVSNVEELKTISFEQMSGSGTLYRIKQTGSAASDSDYEAGRAYKLEWEVGDWSGATGNPNSFLRELKTIKTTIRWKEKGVVSSAVLFTFDRGRKAGDL